MDLNYKVFNNGITIYNQKDFDIKQILECGQSFRFKQLDENKFSIVAHNRVIEVTTNGETIEIVGTNEADFFNIWLNYFDLNTDYQSIKNIISKDDVVMQNCIKYGSGIRILRQDPFEIIITFIISQNNRITMIKTVIENISRAYGTKIDEENYAFPTFEQLKDISIEDLNSLKTGFRSKYIRDFLDKLSDNTINIENLKSLDNVSLKSELMKVKGIGSKVSDCICLFGFSRTSAFPVDVWIKRVVEYFYFDKKDIPIKEIEKFGIDNFGEYGGYAQQYLFYYAREEQIGK